MGNKKTLYRNLSLSMLLTLAILQAFLKLSNPSDGGILSMLSLITLGVAVYYTALWLLEILKPGSGIRTGTRITYNFNNPNITFKTPGAIIMCIAAVLFILELFDSFHTSNSEHVKIVNYIFLLWGIGILVNIIFITIKSHSFIKAIINTALMTGITGAAAIIAGVLAGISSI